MAACSRIATASRLGRRKGSPRPARTGSRNVAAAAASRMPARQRSSARIGLTPAAWLSAATSSARSGGWFQRMSLRGLAGTRPLVLGRHVGVRLDMLPIPLVPPVEDRAGDEDGREGAGDDADEEGEREVLHHAGAED